MPIFTEKSPKMHSFLQRTKD
jgi:hypothetical protein